MRCLNLLPLPLVAGCVATWRLEHLNGLRPANPCRGSPGSGGVPQGALGIAFTCDPVSGADRIVVEAAWGLGKSIVSGAVIPDHFVLTPDGRVLESVVGDKDVSIVASDSGTTEVAVDPELQRVPCIEAETLTDVAALATRGAEFFGCPQDVEVGARRRRDLVASKPSVTA